MWRRPTAQRHWVATPRSPSTSVNYLADPDEVSLTVPEPDSTLAQAFARVLPVDLGDSPFVSNPGMSTSSNTRPRSLSSATTTSMSSTSNTNCVVGVDRDRNMRASGQVGDAPGRVLNMRSGYPGCHHDLLTVPMEPGGTTLGIPVRVV